MIRACSSLAAVLVIVVSAGGQAGGLPNGTYKLTLFRQTEALNFWLIKIGSKDGKLEAALVATAEKAPDVKVSDISLKEGLLRLALSAGGQQAFSFQGRLTGDPKKILGSFAVNSRTVLPAQLALTELQSFDNDVELHKEALSNATSAPEIFGNALVLLQIATPKTAKLEEVRAWAAKASKASEPYGEIWQREVALRIADAAYKHEEFLPVALVYAQQAERLLGPADSAAVQRRVLGVLKDVLSRAGKTADAKEVSARLDKIPLVALNKTASRKGAGDRAVLVELFTGVECPPCVAADLAFDALSKTFKPSEVVLLQYHEHIPAPDPLTSPDGEARLRYYAKEVEGTPTIIFNGQPDQGGGGGQDEAQGRYDEYLTTIGPQLEKAAKAKLQVKATRKGNKLQISADVAELAEPGDKTRLRLVLVEEEVAYKGGNRLERHHSVVRAFPGGSDGVAVKDKAFKHQVSIDIDDLRKQLKDYLDKYSKEEGPFSSPERPLELKNLSVVAFLQNDATKEVLQAVQAKVLSE